MSVSQINQSFQNDGNFSQLDLRDIANKGPILRIETYRCSQPEGEFGITESGSSVTNIAGNDHLGNESNRTFRHIFSTGDIKNPKATLEIREFYNENGAFEVRTRDIDSASPSFSFVLINNVQPVEKGIHIHFELRASKELQPVTIHSPITKPVTDQVRNLPDISNPVEKLGSCVPIIDQDYIDIVLELSKSSSTALDTLNRYAAAIQEAFPVWTKNVKTYERMGDFRDKCIHPGVNLTGDNPALASEYVLIRAYRMSLISLGRIFDEEMSAGAEKLNAEDVLSIDTKPGVYSIFLSAYALNIGLYQLGIDKVHSDYGGIPMEISPGSRLEDGSIPIVDATNLNRMLALLSCIYYAPSATPQILNVKPSIKKNFDIKEMQLLP